MAPRSTDRMDELVGGLIDGRPNLLVPWYLMASYAYYVLDSPIISDGMYDAICFMLLNETDMLNVDHPHAALCDPEALEAGTGYHLSTRDYPSIVKSAAEKFVRGDLP